MTTTAAFLRGAGDTVGLAVAAGLFGLLFGVAAVTAGMSAVTAVSLSATVLAGSAQFAALALWQSPLPLATIALTTALVGARHVLMGIQMRPIAEPVPTWRRLLGIALMTDFNWAITVTAPVEKRRFGYFLGSGLTLYVLWTGGTVLGVALPQLLTPELRMAAAGAGTLFLTAIACVIATNVGRPALVPIAAAAAAAALADLMAGPTLAPAAAVAAGAVVFLVRARGR